MTKAISITELYTKRRNVMAFEGVWRDLMGCPERKGSIIIYGLSANGKTRFAVRFAKYLTKFGNTAYNSIEEGDSATLARAFKESGITVKDKKLTVLNMESLKSLKERLSKPKSPDIIIVDSLQHWRITSTEYKELVTEFSKKLFVFISHADGKEPAGAIGMAVKYDANVKIHVDRFIAFAETRCEGGAGKPFVIWEARARELHGISFDKIIEPK